MSAGGRWSPRFVPGHAEQVLDIAQEYGFAREPTIGSYEEFDVVDAIEALQWLSERGLFDESGVLLPEDDVVVSGSDRPRPQPKRAAL
jgi:hypothetical protein